MFLGRRLRLGTLVPLRGAVVFSHPLRDEPMAALAWAILWGVIKVPL